MALNEKGGHDSFHPYDQNNLPDGRSMPGMRHRGINTTPPTPQYKWEMTDWTECNRLCNGESFRTAVCVQESDGRKVMPSQCRPPKPDDQYQTCNTECDVAYVFTSVIIRNPYSHIILYLSAGKLHVRNVQRNAVKVFNKFRINAYKRSSIWSIKRSLTMPIAHRFPTPNHTRNAWDRVQWPRGPTRNGHR